jgi:hypothetical protein
MPRKPKPEPKPKADEPDAFKIGLDEEGIEPDEDDPTEHLDRTRNTPPAPLR